MTLDVHHRTYERLGNESPDDLTVLCRDCHKLFSQNGKLSRPSTEPESIRFRHRIWPFIKASASRLVLSTVILVAAIWGLGTWGLGYQLYEPQGILGYSYGIPSAPGLAEGVVFLDENWTVLACSTENGIRAVATDERFYREVTALQSIMRLTVVPVAQALGLLPREMYELYMLEGKPKARMQAGESIDYCIIDAFEAAEYVEIGFATKKDAILVAGFPMTRDELIEAPEFLSWIRKEMGILD